MSDLPTHPSAEAAATTGGADDIQERIRRYVVQAFRDGRAEGIDAATPIVTSGIVDSAGVLQVIDWLEATFGIEIADDDVSAENFDTLEALAALVRTRLAG